MRAGFRAMTRGSAGAVALVLALALGAAMTPAAARAQAMVGIYFDNEATQTYLACHQCPDMVLTAYVIATGAEQTIGGVAYSLSFSSWMALLSATYPRGVQIGDPLQGIQVGFTDCAYCFGDNHVLISTLSIWKPEGVDTVRLRVDPYPPAGVVQMADCDGNLRTVEGGAAWVMDPVPVEAQTWGAVKGLYGD